MRKSRICLIGFLVLFMLFGCVDHNAENRTDMGYIMTIEDNTSAFSFLDKKQMEVFKEINTDSLEDIIKSKRSAVVLIYSNNSEMCISAADDIINLAIENNRIIYYLDIARFSQDGINEKYSRIINLLSPVLFENEETKNKSISIPQIIIIENGEFVDTHIGLNLEKYESMIYIPKRDLISYQENDLLLYIPEIDFEMNGYGLSEEQLSVFKHINSLGLKAILDNKEDSVLFIGMPSCGFCVKLAPIIANIAIEKGLRVFYMDAGYFPSFNEDYRLSNKYLWPVFTDDGSGGKIIIIPEVVKIVDGEFFDWEIGYTDDIERYYDLLSFE